MDPQQLLETIAAAKAGSAEHFDALLKSYGPRLYGYFLRATGHHQDAEDLLGDMSLKLVRQLNSYDERGRFEPWLFRIAANMVRDRIRRIKSRPRLVSLSAEDSDGRNLGDVMSEPGRPPIEAGLLAEEASLELREALEKLDETTREMVLMRFFAEVSFRELAEAFDCPLGTVLAKVHRGLKALRKVMEPDRVDD